MNWSAKRFIYKYKSISGPIYFEIFTFFSRWADKNRKTIFT